MSRRILCLITALFIVAGCSNKDSSAGDSTPANATSSQATQASTGTAKPGTATATVTATAAGGATGGAAPAPQTTSIKACDGSPAVRPSELVLACADAGAVVSGITWDSWANDTATGSGTLTTKTCEPDCASGGTQTRTVGVTLHTPVRDPNGASRFTVATVGSKGDFQDYTLG
ncbi:hypothetical protein GCM10009551_082970 [Nocardiopsis tropica]|uniref:hypothetical protein n=1 Tax=Tsukamurella strandjordii TaxID=147577 RepID=UPI0031D58CBA